MLLRICKDGKPVKSRATKAEMAQRYADLLAICAEHRPATVRGIFYQATVRKLVDKDENGYDIVGTALVKMRKAGNLDYDWIVDLTRSVNEPLTFVDPADAIEWLTDVYRENPWHDQPIQVQVWLEKAALEGVIEEVTRNYCAPLMVSRGFSSITFLEDCARRLDPDKPAWIFHLGDRDPSGISARTVIESTLRERGNYAELHFIALAVTPEQALTLPSRPTKKSDSRSKNFKGDSVELDAIAPNELRALVRQALQELMPELAARAVAEGRTGTPGRFNRLGG